MASLRTYCKHDPIIVQKLFWMLKYLLNQEAFKEDYKKSVTEELNRLKKDSKSILEELMLE